MYYKCGSLHQACISLYLQVDQFHKGFTTNIVFSKRQDLLLAVLVDMQQ